MLQQNHQHDQRRAEQAMSQMRMYQRQAALLIEQMALLQRSVKNSVDDFMEASGQSSHDARDTPTVTPHGRQRKTNTATRRLPHQVQRVQESPSRGMQTPDAYSSNGIHALALSMQNDQTPSTSSLPAQMRSRVMHNTQQVTLSLVGSAEEPIEVSLPDLPEINTSYYVSATYAMANKNWRQNVWPWDYKGRRMLKDGLVREYRACLGSEVCSRPGCGTHARPKQRNVESQVCSACGESTVHVECPATFIVTTPRNGSYHLATFEHEHTHPPPRAVLQFNQLEVQA
jgi:hypothetical protein